MQPKVRGNIIAGSLIGATFARSFGADGMWEGTVAQVPVEKVANERPGGGLGSVLLVLKIVHAMAIEPMI